MNDLTTILEQVKKKIKLSDYEGRKYRFMTNQLTSDDLYNETEICITFQELDDLFFKLIEKNTGIELNRKCKLWKSWGNDENTEDIENKISNLKIKRRVRYDYKKYSDDRLSIKAKVYEDNKYYVIYVQSFDYIGLEDFERNYLLIQPKDNKSLKEDIKKIALSDKEKFNYLVVSGKDLNSMPLEKFVDLIFNACNKERNLSNKAIIGYYEKDNVNFIKYMSERFGRANSIKPDKEREEKVKQQQLPFNSMTTKQIIKTWYVGKNYKISKINHYDLHTRTWQDTYIIVKSNKGFLKEQIIKKIKLGSDKEDLNLRNLLGKEINADKYLKKMYEYKAPALQEYIAKFHIPKEFAEAFDKNKTSRVLTPDVESGEILDQLLQPYKQNKSGYEKTKTFAAKWERYITEDYIVMWINLVNPKIIESKRTFWLIKPKN